MAIAGTGILQTGKPALLLTMVCANARKQMLELYIHRMINLILISKVCLSVSHLPLSTELATFIDRTQPQFIAQL